MKKNDLDLGGRHFTLYNGQLNLPVRHAGVGGEILPLHGQESNVNLVVICSKPMQGLITDTRVFR